MTSKASISANISIALVHYPVYDKNRRTVASAITNLDLHDIARAAKTFGLHKYFVVTPLQEQKILAERIARHWQKGWGAEYNPKRRTALDLVTLADSLDDVLSELQIEYGTRPQTVATGAKGKADNISYPDMRRLLSEKADQPFLLLFGTGWGLHEEIVARADHSLSPIIGRGGYNHLSVRSAVSIILDRLLGRAD